MAQRVKCLPAMQETRVRSLGQEDPLEKEMATHSSTLAWKIPWMEEPGSLQSMGSQRVRRLSDFPSPLDVLSYEGKTAHAHTSALILGVWLDHISQPPLLLDGDLRLSSGCKNGFMHLF